MNRTEPSTSDWLPDTPVAHGLFLGLLFTLTFLLFSGSVGAAVAAAPFLLGLGLLSAFVVETAQTLLRPRADDTATQSGDSSVDTSVGDALNRLRDRYAAGELSDEQFERKLEVILDTETPENARAYANRVRSDEPNVERELDR